MQATAKVFPIFLYYTDLLKIYPHLTTTAGAHKKYTTLKKCLGKKDHQMITVKEFADWQDVPVEDIVQALQK